MLRIGEFSALTGISINMLRNYDKLGLLKPETVDGFTEYRYYSERQLPQAQTLQSLKRLGFSLAQIGEILQRGALDASVQTMLEEKLLEKERELEALKAQLVGLRHARADLATEGEIALSVRVKKLPARKIVRCQGVLSAFDEEGLLWERLHTLCARHQVPLSDTPYSFARTNSVDIEHKRIDTEVWLQVDRLIPDADGLRFISLPEMEVAAVAYRGEYLKIKEINDYLRRWSGENGYQLCGQPFQTYYISPAAEGDPKNYVTEVCHPVKKIEDAY